jgi:hypothetical protein
MSRPTHSLGDFSPPDRLPAGMPGRMEDADIGLVDFRHLERNRTEVAPKSGFDPSTRGRAIRDLEIYGLHVVSFLAARAWWR